MLELKCGECGKIISGYNKEHADYILAQHMLAHSYKPATKKKSPITKEQDGKPKVESKKEISKPETKNKGEEISLD